MGHSEAVVVSVVSVSIQAVRLPSFVTIIELDTIWTFNNATMYLFFELVIRGRVFSIEFEWFVLNIRASFTEATFSNTTERITEVCIIALSEYSISVSGSLGFHSSPSSIQVEFSVHILSIINVTRRAIAISVFPGTEMSFGTHLSKSCFELSEVGLLLIFIRFSENDIMITIGSITNYISFSITIDIDMLCDMVFTAPAF